MRNVLVVVTSLVIALVAVLFAVPRFVDWDGYRGTIEEEATRLLGRDVRVGGKVQVSLLPSPAFSVENIRIADVQANAGEPFFRAETLSGTLALTPLFRGVLQASEIVLRRPQMHIVLDADGGGNWKSLGQGGNLPFLPSDVALQAVRIEQGQLSIYGPDRVERVHVEAIDGEFSAQALDGPFRFRGYFGADPMRREFRFASTRQEADGGLRFKATLKQLDTGSTFNFDARAVDLARAPRLEGELSALIPLPQLQASAGKIDEAPVEIKAALSAGARAVKLSNLSLAFERQGRPQILSGEAQASLAAPFEIDILLAAKWLDLDQLIGAPAAASTQPAQGTPAPSSAQPTSARDGPLGGLLVLATRLNGFNPETGTARLTLDIEQANLGREPVSGVRLRLSGRGAETDIQELRIGLPGGARADIKGLMTGAGEETAFDGSIVLRGASLARFLGWSSGGAVVLDPARDGPFAMRSRLKAAGQGIEARDLVGELAGTIMQGELGYRWQPRPEISVTVEGPLVDLRPVLPERGSILQHIMSGTAVGKAHADLDAVLRIRAGQLIVPGASYQDASADIELRAGRVRIGQVRLAMADGVLVELEGDVPTAQTSARGTLQGMVMARDVAGLTAVADLLGVPRAVMPSPAVLAELVPMRMAGTAQFSNAPSTPLDVTGAGEIAGSPIRLRTRLDDGLAGWHRGGLDLSLAVDGPRARTLVAALTGADAADTGAAGAPRLAVDAVGSLASRLTGRIAYAAGASAAEFRGEVSRGTAAEPPDLRSVRLSGDVKLEAADGEQIVRRIFPAMPAGVLAGVPLAGTFAIDQADGESRLTRLAMRAGEANVRGQLVISAGADGRSVVTGALHATRLSADGLLRALVAPDAVKVAAGGAPRQTVWPTATVDKRLLAQIQATIAIEADELHLPGAGALRDARLSLALAPGRLDISDLTGRAAGGQWQGGLKLSLPASGVPTAVAIVRFADVDAARMFAAARPPIETAVISGLLTLTGQGQSLDQLVGSLSGRGSLAAGATRLSALAPAGVTAAVETAVRGPAEAMAANLRRALAEGEPAAQQILIPARSIAVEVKDGVLTASPVVADLDGGQLRSTLSVDLSAMRLTSEWRVIVPGEAMPPPPGWTATVTPAGAAATAPKQKPLPPVVVTFAAPLGALDAGTVAHTTEPLEREISVRRMERDLEDLERLRKLDEERAKEEAERRRLPLALPPVASPIDGSTPLAPPPLQADQPSAVPDTIDPSLRPRPAAPASAAPAPKPAYRPLSQEEQRRIFGGG